MPVVKKIYENFKKQYGKDATTRYYAWLNDKPDIAKKALATARKKGDVILKEIPKMVKTKKVKTKKK